MQTLLRENVTDAGAIAHRPHLPEARFDESLKTGEDWELLLRLTADALAAPSADAAERARNDPRLGSGGVATLTLALALGIACLATLATEDTVLAAAAVVVAATVSRSAAPVAALAWSRTGRAPTSESSGAGAWFVRLVGPPEIAVVLATSLVAIAAGTALAGPAVALGSVGGISAGAAIATWVLLRRGQLDGDGYGAVIELVFVAMLSGIAVAGSLR